jgi:iron complex outermembrane receptor protein
MTARFGLTLGTGVRYTGSSYGDPANSFKVGSYTLVDALVRYDLARVGMAGSNVALHVNNLFDREYVASCFNTYGCFWGAERQVVATATFRFYFIGTLCVPVLQVGCYAGKQIPSRHYFCVA